MDAHDNLKPRNNMLRLSAFGGLQIEIQGRSIQRLPRIARNLLAYLIVHQDRPIARDLLAGTFWPDRSNSRARRALSQAAWQVRSALGAAADRLEATPESLFFTLSSEDWFDVAAFEALAGDPEASAEKLERAVDLQRADFLEGCYDDWALLERERLREIHLRCLERLVFLYKQTSDFEKALACARRLCTVDPLRESAHREVMRLLHLLGRGSAALQQYRILGDILAEELDVEPFQETVLLAHRIAAEMGQADHPYLPLGGAAPAHALDQLPLVGRVEERARLLAYLEATVGGRGGIALVAGEAGAGKTRLLRELMRDAEWRGVNVGWGRGVELSDLPPYGLWNAVMSSVLSPLRANQLVELVDNLWIREAARVLPALTNVLPDAGMGVHLGLEQMQGRLLEALTQIALALGTIAPHVLILDDLQWADHATLDLLQHLAPRLGESRLLVIGSYRSEEVRESQAIWEALKSLDQVGGQRRILLRRLSLQQTAEMVAYGLGLAEDADGLDLRIHRETDGNPLFIVEVMRALRDAGGVSAGAAGALAAPAGERAPDDDRLPLPRGVRRVI
jgi:DNA-binding SARP family transcriptional activator